jgi:hypothetical protein
MQRVLVETRRKCRLAMYESKWESKDLIRKLELDIMALTRKVLPLMEVCSFACFTKDYLLKLGYSFRFQFSVPFAIVPTLFRSVYL